MKREERDRLRALWETGYEMGECLCGLPGCDRCDAAQELKREILHRCGLPGLLDALDAAEAHIAECHGTIAALNSAEVDAVLRGREQGRKMAEQRTAERIAEWMRRDAAGYGTSDPGRLIALTLLRRAGMIERGDWRGDDA